MTPKIWPDLPGSAEADLVAEMHECLNWTRSALATLQDPTQPPLARAILTAWDLKQLIHRQERLASSMTLQLS